MRAEFPARPTTESISAALACSARGSAQNSAYPRPSRAPPAGPARRFVRGRQRTFRGRWIAGTSTTPDSIHE